MNLSSVGGSIPHPTCSGNLLIVGGGRCVWKDVIRLPDMDVMTINDMVQYWPGEVKHAYSNDDVQLLHWLKGRRHRWNKTVPRLHSTPECKSGVEVWDFPSKGSSALPACYVGLALGYGKIYLAGCPLDDTGHFYDPPEGHPLWKGEKPTNFSREAQMRVWVSARDHVFEGRVISLSGRSKRILENG